MRHFSPFHNFVLINYCERFSIPKMRRGDHNCKIYSNVVLLALRRN
jgi:hypothetical protein